MSKLEIADLLSAAQTRQVLDWLGDIEVIADLSWEITATTVLRLRASNQEYILKAGSLKNHHLTREIRAHRHYTKPLKDQNLAAQMRFASDELSLLVLDYLPGILTEGTTYEFSAEIHRQAGAALKMFHAQGQRLDKSYERRLTEKTLLLLGREHRIQPGLCRQAEQILRDYEPQPALLVPAHGDWQPRNWLVDQGQLLVIDFGRFEFRPAASDFARLSVQQWRDHPELETAFVEGYGQDPRDTASWPLMQLREAIGTSVWAYEVGDEDFEAQGHQMMRWSVAEFGVKPA